MGIDNFGYLNSLIYFIYSQYAFSWTTPPPSKRTNFMDDPK